MVNGEKIVELRVRLPRNQIRAGTGLSPSPKAQAQIQVCSKYAISLKKSGPIIFQSP